MLIIIVIIVVNKYKLYGRNLLIMIVVMVIIVMENWIGIIVYLLIIRNLRYLSLHNSKIIYIKIN